MRVRGNPAAPVNCDCVAKASLSKIRVGTGLGVKRKVTVKLRIYKDIGQGWGRAKDIVQG